MCRVLQQLGLEPLYRLAHLRRVFQMIGAEGVVGTGVVGTALLEHRGNVLAQLIGRLALNQRTLYTGNGKAGENDIDRSLEEYGDSHRIHILHVVIEAGSAAASGYDDIFKLGNLVKHFALYLTEPLFATLGKELRYGAMVAVLDIVVEVDKLQASLFFSSCVKSL